MKKKESFVTNSSSTSYVIIGNEVTQEHVLSEFSGRKTPRDIYVVTDYRTSDGEDVFQLTKKMVYYIRKGDVNGWIRYYKVITMFDRNGEGVELTKLKPFIDKEGVRVYFIDKSYHCTESDSDFISKFTYGGYCEEED